MNESEPALLTKLRMALSGASTGRPSHDSVRRLVADLLTWADEIAAQSQSLGREMTATVRLLERVRNAKGITPEALEDAITARQALERGIEALRAMTGGDFDVAEPSGN